MGDAAISAAQSTYNQLVSIGYLDTKVGICPMLGINDVQSEIFTLADASKVLAFASSTSYIGLLTFWSVNRDISQTTISTYSSATQSGIVQELNAFTKIFSKFTSITPIPTPTPMPAPAPTPMPAPEPPAPIIPTPAPTTNSWASGVNYTVGIIVSYQNHIYKCVTVHTSIVTWAPGPWTGSLWQLIS